MILAVTALVAIGSAFSFHGLPVNQVHAQPNLWFISWIGNDQEYQNLPFGLQFAVGDTQSSTITVTTDWNDGSITSQTVTGTWDNTPPCYQVSPLIGHVYMQTGTFNVKVTLSDPLGNFNSATMKMVVSPNQQTNTNNGGVGGKQPVVM